MNIVSESVDAGGDHVETASVSGAGSAAAGGATTSTSRVSSSWRIDATASSSRSCSTASASSATSSTRPCSSACSRNSRTAGSTIIVVSSFSSFSFVGTCGAQAEPQAKAGTRRAPVRTTLPGFGFPNQPQPQGLCRLLGSGREQVARARPRDRPQAAVQVLGAHPRGLLGHGRAGHRLLRPLPALLRPGPGRVPPAPRDALRAGRRSTSSSCAPRRSSTSRRRASTT